MDAPPPEEARATGQTIRLLAGKLASHHNRVRVTSLRGPAFPQRSSLDRDIMMWTTKDFPNDTFANWPATEVHFTCTMFLMAKGLEVYIVELICLSCGRSPSVTFARQWLRSPFRAHAKAIESRASDSADRGHQAYAGRHHAGRTKRACPAIHIGDFFRAPAGRIRA